MLDIQEWMRQGSVTMDTKTPNYRGKLRSEHYAHMLAAIRPFASKLAGHREALKRDSRVKDLEKRLRWDACYAAGLTKWICDNLYSYANDEHIDTALRSIMAEL